MKWIVMVLLALTAHLQYRLWSGGDGSIGQIRAHEARLQVLAAQVEEKKQRNAVLYAELADLKTGQEAIEERARYELGMIRPGETFFQVID